ncbi:LysR family transcriptional regulator [Arenicella xantha]|uniref:LysR family transcriptional regulator n=1 Tax=Arenicella xantha TaxID=644221 RepID=A0A395JLD3_9GAMM|nr:LysR family transcriptional regulator [Arenicella xantha]RBP50657.1 LysR family transcriptional regulator [Arenicella xantha]
MKLDQLMMFISVAELGSLSGASREINKTQPAISQAIRQLENSLNLELFSRSGYRLALTDAGKVVYQQALRVKHEAASLRQIADHIGAGNEPSITIAIEASFDLKIVLPILETVQGMFPNTQIVLRQEYISGALEALTNRAATLCISPLDSAFLIDTKLEHHFLASGKLVNVAAPKLVSRHPNLSSSLDLINEYQIVLQGSGVTTKGHNFGVQDGQRCWFVNDFSTKQMLIERGMGWGKVPYFLARDKIDSGELVLLQLSDNKNYVNLSYQIIKNQDQILGPVAQTLWDQFVSITKVE